MQNTSDNMQLLQVHAMHATTSIKLVKRQQDDRQKRHLNRVDGECIYIFDLIARVYKIQDMLRFFVVVIFFIHLLFFNYKTTYTTFIK